MQKLTVGHQKETIDRMEKDIEFFKTQTSKFLIIYLRDRRRQKATVVLIFH